MERLEWHDGMVINHVQLECYLRQQEPFELMNQAK